MTVAPIATRTRSCPARSCPVPRARKASAGPTHASPMPRPTIAPRPYVDPLRGPCASRSAGVARQPRGTRRLPSRDGGGHEARGASARRRGLRGQRGRLVLPERSERRRPHPQRALHALCLYSACADTCRTATQSTRAALGLRALAEQPLAVRAGHSAPCTLHTLPILTLSIHSPYTLHTPFLHSTLHSALPYNLQESTTPSGPSGGLRSTRDCRGPRAAPTRGSWCRGTRSTATTTSRNTTSPARAPRGLKSATRLELVI